MSAFDWHRLTDAPYANGKLHEKIRHARRKNDIETVKKLEWLAETIKEIKKRDRNGKITNVGFIFDTETGEGVLFIDYESNSNEQIRKCAECGGKLVRGNSKGAFDCTNQKCALISVLYDKNGDFARFKYDCLMSKRKVVVSVV